jgi:membrane protein required for colicin V production
MGIFDIILIIALSGFVFYGLFFGLIRTLGTFIGVIVGAFIAGHFYLTVSDWVTPLFFGFNNLGKVIVFLILFSLANRLVSLIFYLIEKVFNIISIIPFLKTINRLGGLALGFLTGILTIGLVLFVISRYAFLEHWFGQWLAGSQLAPFFIKSSGLLLPLLPQVLKKLQSIIN